MPHQGKPCLFATASVAALAGVASAAGAAIVIEFERADLKTSSRTAILESAAAAAAIVKLAWRLHSKLG